MSGSAVRMQRARRRRVLLVSAISASLVGLGLAGAGTASSASPGPHPALSSRSVPSRLATTPPTAPRTALPTELTTTSRATSDAAVPTAMPSHQQGGGPTSVYYDACGTTTSAGVAATYVDRDNKPVVLRCGNALSWGYWYVDNMKPGGWDATFDHKVRTTIANGTKSDDGTEYDYAGFVVMVEPAPMADGTPQGIMNAFMRATP